MVKTYKGTKEDFFMIGYYLDIDLNCKRIPTIKRQKANRIRIDMNNKVKMLISTLTTNKQVKR